ncbi:unnamed protein product [Amoebophrya sp. A25]|nr:unnamed protein product [Amoebophrya sp. A25]|eukprot:GSA25T00027749001.1
MILEIEQVKISDNYAQVDSGAFFILSRVEVSET